MTKNQTPQATEVMVNNFTKTGKNSLIHSHKHTQIKTRETRQVTGYKDREVVVVCKNYLCLHFIQNYDP